METSTLLVYTHQRNGYTGAVSFIKVHPPNFDDNNDNYGVTSKLLLFELAIGTEYVLDVLR